MAADFAVARAGVHTGTAADAAQNFLEGRAENVRAAVVKNDEVEFFRTVHVVGFARPGEPRVVAGQTRTHGRAGEHRDENVNLLEGGRNTFHPHYSDVGLGERGRETGVTFVRDETDRARFGHREVTARDTHLGGEEVLAHRLAQERRHVFRRIRPFVAELFVERFADLHTVTVNGGHDDVRGLVACDLQNVFPEVGFDDTDAVILQNMVHADFLGDHGLGFHDLLGVFLFAHLKDVLARFLLGLREVDVTAVGLDLLGELEEECVEVLEHIVTDLGGTVAPAVNVTELGHDLGTVRPDHVLGLGDGAAHDVVIDLRLGAVMERQRVGAQELVGIGHLHNEALFFLSLLELNTNVLHLSLLQQ